MRLRKENALLSLALGTGVYLLEVLRDRLEDTDHLTDRARRRFDDLRHKASDLRDRAADAYDTAADRASRAADVLRGEDHPIVGKAAALLIGVGVGVGVGLLLAPASGEETRSNIREKVADRFSRERDRATGTHGM